MTPDTILTEVRQLFHDKLGRNESLDRETHIVKDLGIDSLGQLSIVVEIENHFEIYFDPDGTRTVETIGDVVDEVYRCLTHKNSEDNDRD